MRRYIVGLATYACLFTPGNQSWAQVALSGRVTHDGHALAGATVAAGPWHTSSDSAGFYQLLLPEGDHTVVCRMMGYRSQEKKIIMQAGQPLRIDFELERLHRELDVVVVSASRYEKNITEETVSMEVLQRNQLLHQNPLSMDEALQRIPGLTIINNQANIRGGSGYSYGAGSRVLMVVDDIPQLTADANDIKWDFLPLESIKQVEVIKGASSVLYGSSALNGVIHVRSDYATSTPQTRLTMYQGVFMNPRRKELIWWGQQQPMFGGGYFMHSRRIHGLDLVVGGNVLNDNSVRQGEFNQRARCNIHTQYRFKNVEGLRIGLNTNMQINHSGTYFFWADGDSGGYRPLGGMDPNTTTISVGENTRLSIDPHLTYLTPKQLRHALRMRYFLTQNKNNTNQSSTGRTLYGEYQLLMPLGPHTRLIAGCNSSRIDVQSELYDNHEGSNAAVFLQAEQKFYKLTLSGGVRYELFTLDTMRGNSKPVFRCGLNYPLTPATFLRASYGQGYRFPSVAEKFINTSIDVLRIFPNPDLDPERGWTAELGIKQGFQVAQWQAFADLSFFVQRYENLIEFTFGYYDPQPIPGQINLNYLGFKSINIENARITGSEFTLLARKAGGTWQSNVVAGINIIHPVNLNQQHRVDSLLQLDPPAPPSVADSLKKSVILKYRFPVTAKLTADLRVRRWAMALAVQYYSFMTNIDPFFEGTDPLLIYIFGQPTEFIPGIKDYRAHQTRHTWVADLQFGYSLSQNLEASCIVKNVLNKEYTIRPALIEPPRSVQLLLQARL